MTIKEAAEQFGVSKQAIYQRMKRNGLAVDTLVDKETGQLTPEAEAIIVNLFGENKQQFDKRRFTPTEELKQAKEEISRLQREVEMLTFRIEAAEKEAASLRETLETERALFQRFLPAAGETQRPGLMKRIAAAFRGK